MVIGETMKKLVKSWKTEKEEIDDNSFFENLSLIDPREDLSCK